MKVANIVVAICMVIVVFTAFIVPVYADETLNISSVMNETAEGTFLPSFLEVTTSSSDVSAETAMSSTTSFQSIGLQAGASSSSVQPAIEWQRVIGAPHTEDLPSIRQTTDGGYVTCGLTDVYYPDGDIIVPQYYGNGDMWIMKLDTSGNTVWQNVYGGYGRDECRSIRQTSDGGYVLVGISNSTNGEFTGKNHGGYDMYVVKTDANGAKQWQSLVGGTDNDLGIGIRQTSDGGYIVTGYSDHSNGRICQFSMETDAWVAKLDANGNVIWQKSLGGTGGDQGTSIIQTSDGRYIMYGFSSSSNSYSQNHGAYDLWLVFLDSDGNVLDERLYGGTGFEATGNVHDDGIQLTSDGGFILFGQSSTYKNGDVGFNHGYYGDIWVLKFDSTHQLQWQKTLGGWDSEMASGGIQETPDGGFVFTAATESSDSGDVDTNHGDLDIWAVKIDKNGELIRQVVLGGSKSEHGGTIQPTIDGGYILSGSTLSSNSGDVGNNHAVSDGWADGWVVKLKPKSLDVPDDVKRYVPNVQFDLKEQFYPTNPFFYTDDIYETGGENGKKNYLQMNSEQKMDNFTVYYRVVDTPINRVYQYWYYYTYNDWLNQHYHDWEKTYVFVNKNTGEINVTVADAHEWWCPNSQLENPGIDHLGILAENGGHAFAIDKDEDGTAAPWEVSYQPSYQQPLFGGIGAIGNPPNLKYLWIQGLKVPANDIHYKLREISPGFIRKFRNEPEFPNSPTLGFVKIIYPILGKDYVFEIGGKSATLPWKSPEYDNPDKIIKRAETIIKGIVNRAAGTTDDSPTTVAVFSDSPKWSFTNQSGYFEMINIEPGMHEVVVNAEGFAPYKQRFYHENDTTLGVDGVMNMFPESESFRIVGYVKNPDNSSADNITVDVYDNTDTRILTTLTDANGTYLFFVSEKSDYRAVATKGSSTGSAKLKGIAGSIVGGNITLGTDRTWPVANFTASLTTIPNYQFVQFNDTSKNIPEKWYWDFGDGANSTEQNPLHLYRTVGNFTVSYTAANDLGSDTITRVGYINVYDAGLPPVAGYSSNYTSSTGPFYPILSSTIQFIDQSQVSGNSTQWFWDFGDGTNSSEQNPVHTLSFSPDASGYNWYDTYYYVTLTVTDQFGRTSTASDYFVIFNDTHVDFMGEPTSGSTPLTVNFTELPDDIPEDWVWWRMWDFGDGSSYEWNSWNENGTVNPPLKNIAHGYASPGNYTVTLYKQYNEMGYYGKTKEHYILVGGYSNLPVADFTANTTFGKEPLAVAFSDQSTHSPNNWTWSFGDGANSTDQNPIHVYTEAGTYTVSLTAANNDGSNTTVKQDYIHVLPTEPPVAEFSANVTSGYSPLPVAFTDLSTNAPVNWTWDFGDSTSSTEQNPEHTFAVPGNYTVSLLVMNDEGMDNEIKTEYITVVINIPEVIPDPEGFPFAEFTANTTYGKAPLTVEFVDLTQNATTRWNWTFGDGGPSTERFPIYTYSSPGTYTVSLSTGNIYGENSSTKIDYITVVPVILPDANFTAAPRSGKAPLTVVFNDTSSGFPTGWNWDFGDGTTSTGQHPVHEYGATGNYSVSLRVTNEDGSDTETRPDYITVLPVLLPSANFTANVTSGKAPLAVRFNDTSSGSPASWSWTFGDGGISDDQNPSHIYMGTGTFTVSLEITNPDGSNTTTKTDYITVTSGTLPPVANFTGIPTCGKAPLSVTFTDLSTGTPAGWFWDFGDGTNATEQNPVHGYTIPGRYTVSLTATNAGGSNTSIRKDYITVSGSVKPPVANFYAKPTSGKLPLSVVFTDTSSRSPTGWFWDFGDGTNSTEWNPVHVYTVPGRYTVSLTVTNAGGSDTKTRTEYITVKGTPPPSANFYGKPMYGKAPLSVKFTDTSTGIPTGWYWEFGDGTNETVQHPVHNYSSPGKYSVSLTASNAGGNTTKTRTQYITVSAPTPTPTPTQTCTPSQCEPHTVPAVQGTIENGKIRLDWNVITNPCLQGYKVVISKNNPNLKYPDDGYMFWITDRNRNYSIISSTDHYNGGDFGGYLQPGQKYYFSITAVYSDSKVAGNVVELVYPESGTPTTTVTTMVTTNPSTTCTTILTTTSTQNPCEPYTVPLLNGSINQDEKVRLDWDVITNTCLQGYKVVISKNNPNPKYPDDGYMFWITDWNANSSVIDSTIHYNGGDFGGYLQPGQRYNFSIIAVYPDAKIPGNVISLTYPAPV